MVDPSFSDSFCVVVIGAAVGAAAGRPVPAAAPVALNLGRNSFSRRALVTTKTDERLMRCGKAVGVEAIQQSTGVPHCSCGGIIKPDVVLYEESLDDKVLRAAVRAIEGCDLLLVGGTSLAVYPAAGLINYYRGHKLVVINKTPTPADARADWVFHESAAELCPCAAARPRRAVFG